MYRDHIVEEVRKAREDYAAKFDFNLREMIADLQRRQQESGRKSVTLPAKRKPARMAANPMNESHRRT